MSTPEERERLVAVAHRHAAAEAEGDLEATLATLEDDPRYELLPTGIVFNGREAARTYYEHFFSTFHLSTSCWRKPIPRVIVVAVSRAEERSLPSAAEANPPPTTRPHSAAILTKPASIRGMAFPPGP